LIIVIFACFVSLNLNFGLAIPIGDPSTPPAPPPAPTQTSNPPQPPIIPPQPINIPIPLPVIVENTPLPVSLQEINPGLLPLSVAEAPSSPIFNITTNY